MQRHFALAATFLATLLLVACGGGGGASGPAGTYALDTGPMKKAMLDAAGEAADPAARKMVESMMDQMKLELTLRGDGTFTMTSNMNPRARPAPAEKAMTASGTYTITGEQIKLVTTEEDGKPQAPPDEKTGTIKDGVITVGGDGMSMTLRKK